jgi:predicted metal-binding membrane protein
VTVAVRTGALLLGAALAAWIVAVQRMAGMDMGPGTDLGTLGWFVGIWVTMTAAMMLPSVAPMALVYGKAPAARTWALVGGYLAVWTAFGLAAYGVYRAFGALEIGFVPWAAGGAIAAAGLYELTPLKAACLRRCRTPHDFVMHRWRGGAAGALRMGVEHGAYCVGCCWGLMVVLFAVGVMSLTWMAVVAAVIFVQKVLPHGDRLGIPLAAGLVALGLAVALS